MSQLDSLEIKDPDDEKDYAANWAKQLTPYGDTISSSSWIVPGGITKFHESFDSTSATAWFRGGTEGEDYEVTNRIVTSSTPPRVLDQTITIRVRSR